jgi:hypothetical protein
MFVTKPVGRGAAARKYDVLTALGSYALARGKHEQRLVLRLITLITARYNWARDELAVGQREIARLWSVDERTVKREMAKLRGMGWLVVKRQGARGRVTEYALDLERVFLATQDMWAAVGPDFERRMGGSPAEEAVVPFPVRGDVPPPDVSSGTEWVLAQAILHQDLPGPYAAWLRGLVRADRAGGRLMLRAPSRFHAAYVDTHLKGQVLAACQAVDGAVSEIVIVE